ncbi:MAG: peptidoglycan DD-metalloendopeptidase family protein [bacterium]|nr:peptidoglycan DD-metalloendopeptidase family protein [bacterium]
MNFKAFSRNYSKLLFGTLLLAVVLVFLLAGERVFGQTVDELQDEINGRAIQIQELEEEIALYRGQIAETSEQAKTLQNAISRLETERRKLLTEIALTEKKISSVNDSLSQLDLKIKATEESITKNTDALSQIIRSVYEMEEKSFVETVLVSPSLSDALNGIETLDQLSEKLRGRVVELRESKDELVRHKSENENKREELFSLKEDYFDRQALALNNKKEKDKLLASTKSQEAIYKKELEIREQKKQALEAEIFSFESELKLITDPSSILTPKPGVLSWPLDEVTVTQQFGETEFSRANSAIYNGSGHNGVDFRAPRGTKVKSALLGVVAGTGNTDLENGCYSYGKWVMIHHPNGLSTLYAHLDIIKVKTGDTLGTGDAVGFSGNTGYSTGPHLHFGVYATQGVRIVRFGDVRKKTNCPNIMIPVADLSAYLNPLAYLPDLKR